MQNFSTGERQSYGIERTRYLVKKDLKLNFSFLALPGCVTLTKSLTLLHLRGQHNNILAGRRVNSTPTTFIFGIASALPSPQNAVVK